jgi:hypothetical protein
MCTKLSKATADVTEGIVNLAMEFGYLYAYDHSRKIIYRNHAAAVLEPLTVFHHWKQLLFSMPKARRSK